MFGKMMTLMAVTAIFLAGSAQADYTEVGVYLPPRFVPPHAPTLQPVSFPKTHRAYTENRFEAFQWFSYYKCGMQLWRPMTVATRQAKQGSKAMCILCSRSSVMAQLAGNYALPLINAAEHHLRPAELERNGTTRRSILSVS